MASSNIQSQTIEGILKGPMAVAEESRKLMKISQFMNSKGFEMQLKKWCSQNGIVATIISSGFYEFCCGSGMAHILPIEYLPTEYVASNTEENYYCTDSFLIYHSTLERIIFSVKAKEAIALMSKKESEEFEALVTDTQSEIQLAKHRQIFWRPTPVPARPSGARIVVSDASILKNAFKILERTISLNVYVTRNINAEFDSVAAASPAYKQKVRAAVVNRLGDWVQILSRIAIGRWKIKVFGHDVAVHPADLRPSMDLPEMPPDFEGDIRQLLAKVKSNLRPAERRKSMFGGISIGTKGAVTAKEKLQNSSALLHELTAGALQQQAAETFSHSGESFQAPRMQRSLLCDEMLQLIQSFDVVNAQWIKFLSIMLKISGSDSLAQLATNWQTQDLIFADSSNFGRDFGIAEPARIIFTNIIKKLDIVPTETQVMSLVTKLASLRISPQIDAEEYAQMAKTIGALVDVIEVDLASQITRSDVMKITYSLWTKVDPTSSSTAQTKRDQKEEFIDLVTKSGNIRSGIAFLNECYDHIIVRKTQNSVFDSLSAPDQSKVRGKHRYTEDETFTSLESIMLLSNGPPSQSLDLRDNSGGRGGEKKKQFCFYNLRHHTMKNMRPCTQKDCKYSHDTQLTKTERDALTCKNCGRFVCKGIYPSRFGKASKCDNMEQEFISKAPKKQQFKAPTIMYSDDSQHNSQVSGSHLSAEEHSMISQVYGAAYRNVADTQKGKGKNVGKMKSACNVGKGLQSSQMSQAMSTIANSPQHVLALQELSLLEGETLGAGQSQSQQLNPRDKMLSILKVKAAQAGAADAHAQRVVGGRLGN